MVDEVADAITKLREIEDQAQIAFAELPPGSIAYSRLRHIGLLARYARMKLQGAKIEPIDAVGEPSGKPAGTH